MSATSQPLNFGAIAFILRATTLKGGIMEYFGFYQERGDPLPPPSEVVRFDEVQRTINSASVMGSARIRLTLRQMEPTKDWPVGTLVRMGVTDYWHESEKQRGLQTIDGRSLIILPEEAEKFFAPANDQGLKDFKAKCGDGPFIFATREFALDTLERWRQRKL